MAEEIADREAEIVLVAAVAENGVIGHEGDMPWRLPSDLKHFKAITMGKPVVMGRKTFQSIGKALPGRPNFVVTRSNAYFEGAVATASLDEALERASQLAGVTDEPGICIIGGGEIYRQAMERAHRLEITHVKGVIDGDTVFPDINPAIWTRVAETPIPASERDSHDMVFATYLRKG